MPTTTIRLEAPLKTRVAAAASRAGTTPHAFILQAIAQTVEQEELDAEFDRLADARWLKLMTSRQTVSWDETKTWLAKRARGHRARKPAPRTQKR